MVKIGLFGLGTVGRGLLSIVRESDLPFEITAIVDRSYSRKKDIIENIPASDDPALILDNNEIDLVVELMGGTDLALYVVREALDKKKNVITANKFLLAEHGYSLFHKAGENNVSIGFEAAVAGALPIIRNLTDVFAYENIVKVEGILNGTSNYILTVMRQEQKTYKEVLKQAQDLGLAEADPSFDVNGMDAVHKLAIIASLICENWVDYHKIETRGIENVRLSDMLWATKMNYRIRLLAYLEQNENAISLAVEPVLIDSKNFLWDVEMENNAIFLQAQYSGPHVLMGKGAGELPTAYSVFSDIASIALKKQKPLSLVNEQLEYATVQSESQKAVSFYLRFEVLDRPGVLSALSKILADYDISIATVHQEMNKESSKNLVDLMIVTHETIRSRLLAALADIQKLDVVAGDMNYLPIYK